jgi:hypothetical protein
MKLSVVILVVLLILAVLVVLGEALVRMSDEISV